MTDSQKIEDILGKCAEAEPLIEDYKDKTRKTEDKYGYKIKKEIIAPLIKKIPIESFGQIKVAKDALTEEILVLDQGIEIYREIGRQAEIFMALIYKGKRDIYPFFTNNYDIDRKHDYSTIPYYESPFNKDSESEEMLEGLIIPLPDRYYIKYGIDILNGIKSVFRNNLKSVGGDLSGDGT